MATSLFCKGRLSSNGVEKEIVIIIISVAKNHFFIIEIAAFLYIKRKAKGLGCGLIIYLEKMKRKSSCG